MTLLGLSESGYAMIPFFTATGDTVRRAVIYFEVSETCVDSCYSSNNQVITVLDSLLARSEISVKVIDGARPRVKILDNSKN